MEKERKEKALEEKKQIAKEAKMKKDREKLFGQIGLFSHQLVN